MGYTDGTVSASYTYRPNGLRNTETVGTTTERYIWVGDQVALICDGNDLVKEKYAYGNGRISREVASAAGGTIGTRSNYMYNGHGDVVGITDSTGTVTKTYDYDAFGVEVNASATDTNPFRYAGEMWDDTTDSYYLRARNYDPSTGRFTTEDTHWNVGNMIYGDREYGEGERKVADIRAINQSLNRYAYCMNNPIMYVDPSGETIDIAQLSMSDGMLPFADLVALGVLAYQGGKWVVNNWNTIVNGVGWTYRQITGMFKKDSDKVDWGAKKNTRHHIAHGTNGGHENGWRKFGLDPNDPNLYEIILPLLKKAVDEVSPVVNKAPGGGRLLEYTYQLYNKFTLWVRIYEHPNGVRVISDAAMH